MPTTPEYDLPYPAAGAADNVPYDMQALAEATEAAIVAEKALTDAGFAALDPGAWVSVTPASGYTSAMYARIEPDGTIRLRGTITKNSGNMPRATTIATLATDYRPPASVRVVGAIGNGSLTANATAVTIATGGEIQLVGDTTTLGNATIAYFDGVTFQIDTP